MGCGYFVAGFVSFPHGVRREKGLGPGEVGKCILAEGAIALPVTLSGGALFAS